MTDTTAIPTAITGSGADTLVLNISENAYQGDAQFTVSVDGKQLGGTFTASALAGAVRTSCSTATSDPASTGDGELPQ